MKVKYQHTSESSDYGVADFLEDHPSTDVYISGRAGTGKTYALNERAELLESRGKTVIKLAFTGIAASHIKGQTLHSFFGLPFHALLPGYSIRPSKKAIEVLPLVSEIHIDEVSMVRIDVFDAVMNFLEAMKNRPRLVVSGDFAQLPPIVTGSDRNFFQSHWGSKVYAFQSPMWSMLTRFELTKFHRQVDEYFINILECFRRNVHIHPWVMELNKKSFDIPLNNLDIGDAVYLATTNNTANAVNHSHLRDLPGQMEVYESITEGELPSAKICNSPMVLKIKPGARVMMTKNNRQAHYLNGQLGTYIGLKHHALEIKIDTPDGVGRTVYAAMEEWESMEYDVVDKKKTDDLAEMRAEKKVVTKVLGVFTQFPVTLAWGITVHKSQGCTFNKVIVGRGERGFFEFGHCYVAISRCKTLENLSFHTQLRPSDVMTHPDVLNYKFA